jgi:hypothetical protein
VREEELQLERRGDRRSPDRDLLGTADVDTVAAARARVGAEASNVVPDA